MDCFEDGWLTGYPFSCVLGAISLDAFGKQTFYSRTVVQQVNLTTSDGDMGILADHVPIVEQLVPGVIEIVFDAGKSEKLFGGFRNRGLL